MFFGLGVEWSLRRAPGIPLLEVSATIPRIEIPHFELICLQIALPMVNITEKYGGLLIPPFSDVPKDKTIFFTVQFKTNGDLENFLTNGWEKVG